jgi:hypothetical protein
LTTKLSDQQKTELAALLEEERAAQEALRGQEVSDEERQASRDETRARTDERARAVLSAEQAESWTEYRSRSQRGGGMRGFFGGRR